MIENIKKLLALSHHNNLDDYRIGKILLFVNYPEFFELHGRSVSYWGLCVYLEDLEIFFKQSFPGVPQSLGWTTEEIDELIQNGKQNTEINILKGL